MKISLIHLDVRIEFSDVEFKILKDLVACLKPVEVTSESLCSREATLLSADCSFHFCLKNIDTSSEMGRKIYEAMLKRIKERRTLRIYHPYQT